VSQDVKPVQRLGLSAIPVAREKQQAPAPLAQRVAGRRDLQLPDHVVMAAQGQLGVYQILARRLAQLLRGSRLHLGERLIGELCQRPPAPQPQRLTQQPCRRRGSPPAAASRPSEASRSARRASTMSSGPAVGTRRGR
jgi:hypothetical protein